MKIIDIINYYTILLWENEIQWYYYYYYEIKILITNINVYCMSMVI